MKLKKLTSILLIVLVFLASTAIGSVGAILLSRFFLQPIDNLRKAMEQVKKMKKDSAITEDDQKIAEKDLQKVTDSHIEQIEKVGADKEKEIMSV